jgi:hypothetical protein
MLRDLVNAYARFDDGERDRSSSASLKNHSWLVLDSLPWVMRGLDSDQVAVREAAEREAAASLAVLQSQATSSQLELSGSDAVVILAPEGGVATAVWLKRSDHDPDRGVSRIRGFSGEDCVRHDPRIVARNGRVAIGA